jgi:hypothetical protein
MYEDDDAGWAQQQLLERQQQEEVYIHMRTTDEICDAFEITIQQVGAGRVLVVIGNHGHKTWLSMSSEDAKTLAHNILLVAR